MKRFKALPVPFKLLEALLAIALIGTGVEIWLGLPIALIVIGVLVLVDVVIPDR